MAILVHSEIERQGMIALPPGKVEGEPHPARRYHYDGHIMVLDGHPAHVLAHDAREICKIAGHRMASSQECNAYYGNFAAKRQDVLTETRASAPVSVPAPNDKTPPATETAPTPSQSLTSDSAPATSTRKSRKGQ